MKRVGGGAQTRALVIDLFGTLVPKWCERLSSEAKSRMALHLQIEPASFRAAWDGRWWDRELGRLSLEACLEAVVEEVAPATPRGLLVGARTIWSECVARQMVARPEALSALAVVRAAGLRVGLLSNAGPSVPALFRASPMSSFVDAATFSCLVGLAKPDPGVYSAICAALRVAPEECVYLGDGGDEELQGAEQARMRAVMLCAQDEIMREGLPAGAAAWRGPVIHGFHEIVGTLGLAVPAVGLGSPSASAPTARLHTELS